MEVVEFLANPANLVNMIYCALMIWFGFSIWKSNRGDDASKLARIEENLKSICIQLEGLVVKLDRQSTDFAEMKIGVASLKEQTKTLFERVRDLEDESKEKKYEQ